MPTLNQSRAREYARRSLRRIRAFYLEGPNGVATLDKGYFGHVDARGLYNKRGARAARAAIP